MRDPERTAGWDRSTRREWLSRMGGLAAGAGLASLGGVAARPAWAQGQPKRGGILNVVRHEIEVRCRVDAIPEHFDVDLTGLEIGDAVHISAVALPKGVKPTITERDFTVATIVGRAAEEAPRGVARLVGEDREARRVAGEGVVAPDAEAPAVPPAASSAATSSCASPRSSSRRTRWWP